MRTKKRYLVIADVTTQQNADNGDRNFVVTNGKKCICNKDLVGVNTQQVATAQNIIYNYSLEIDRNYFNEQKYCYLDNKLYEIKGTGKAKNEYNMLLHVMEITDDKVKTAILNWLGGNSNANLQ